MTISSNDIGVLIADQVGLSETLQTFDWTSDPEVTGVARFSVDASHGFNDLRIETDGQTFRIQITPINAAAEA